MKQKARRKGKSKNRSLDIRRGWIAVGTLAAYTAVGAVRPALGARSPVPAWEGAPPATLPLERFDIPAGPLEQAIAQFEKRQE